MENLPAYIGNIFILTTVLSVLFFYKATNKSIATLIVIFGWLLIQAFITFTGFYTVTNSMPARFLLLVLPALVTILILFNTNKGKIFIDSLDLKILTLLHIVRIPVEVVLYLLFINKQVPELMTFEGRNFDILSGLTAPVVFYFGYVKQTLSKTILLIWNCICLALLINIVVHAVLSAPSPFQQFAFDQPNVAILYFPFSWLPSCIVPLVLLSHLVVIRRILNTSNTSKNNLIAK